MADQYRLGPALLHAGTGTHAPDTFRSALLRALDSRGRVAVALTCTAGPRWLLTEWPQAGLQLTVRPAGADVPDSSVLRRMQRASQWLLVRGKPLSLTVKQQGQGPSADGYWQTVLGALGSGHAHSGLSLSLQLQHIPASLLQLVGSAFPGLTTLSLGSVSAAPRTRQPPSTAPPDNPPRLRRQSSSPVAQCRTIPATAHQPNHHRAAGSRTGRPPYVGRRVQRSTPQHHPHAPVTPL